MDFQDLDDTANIDERVRKTMVFKNNPIRAAEQWFIGSEIKKKATQFIHSISPYVKAAGLGAFTAKLEQDGIAAQVELLSTDDSEKVGVLVGRFNETLGKLLAYLTDPASYATIVAKYETILKGTATL